MKNRIQGIIIGLILGICICSVTLAEPITEMISVVYDNYKLYINGQDFSDYPEDMKPMNYNGRVYLPLRYVSEAMDMNVYWEESTKSIYINKNYSDEFVLTPQQPLEQEQLLTAAVILNQRLKNAGWTELEYSIYEGTIVFLAPRDTLTKEALEQVLYKGTIAFCNAEGTVLLEKSDFKAAYACKDDLISGVEQNYIEMEFTEGGKEKFAAATEEISARTDGTNYVTVTLDGAIISAPYVYNKIDAAKVIINGSFTESGAKSLAAVINSTELPCAFTIESF